MDPNNNQELDEVVYGPYQVFVIRDFSRLLEPEEEVEEEQEQQQQQQLVLFNQNQVLLELPDVGNNIVEHDQQNDGGAMELELEYQHVGGDNQEVQASQDEEKEGNHQQQDAGNDNVDEGNMDEDDDDDDQYIDNVLNMEEVNREGEQRPDIVEYCLVCAEIANYYKEEGAKDLRLKREKPTHGHSYGELYACFCESVGISEDSELFNGWDFTHEAFPFCLCCENKLLCGLTKGNDVKIALSKFIRSRIRKSEDKYVVLDLYKQHDKRFFFLRKHVLGDHFRGQRAMTDDEDENGADPDKENAVTSQISERTTPSSNPISSNLQTNQSELTKPEGRSRIENSLMADHRNGNVSNDSKSTNTNSTSNAGCNNIPRNDENVPPANANRRKRTARLPKIPSFSMELRRPISSNCVKVTPASDVRLDESSGKEKSENLSTDGSSSIQQGTPPVNRKRGRPPKHGMEAKKYKKSPSSAITDCSNILDTKSSRNEHTEMVKRKRGRPRKTSYEISNQSKSGVVTNVSTSINVTSDKLGGRKRGRPRKIGLDIDNQCNYGNESSTQAVKVVVDNSYDDNDVFGVEMYSKHVPMWVDPLNNNNIFYRCHLMIRLQNHQFQCSTCFRYIPRSKDLKNVFFNHFLIYHTDCYQCGICVGSRLRSIYELQHHMAIFHPTCPRIELKTGGRKERKTSIYSTAPPVKQSSSSTKLRYCPICGMPISSFESSEYKKHYYTHMNAVEKRKAKLNDGSRGPLPRKWKRGRTRVNSLIGSQISTYNSATAEEVKKPLVENVAPEGVDVMTENQSPQMTLTCTLCGVKAHNGESLRNHLKIKHNVCKYPECQQSFETVKNLCDHIVADHIITDEISSYKHRCDYCGSVFTTSGQARKHTNQFKCKDVKAEISSMLEKLDTTV